MSAQEHLEYLEVQLEAQPEKHLEVVFVHDPQWAGFSGLAGLGS
jgi:hypothetical protein